MVLGAGAEIQTAAAAPFHCLRRREAQRVAIKSRGRLHILDEKLHRPQADDLERPRQEHAVDVVSRGQAVDVAVARKDVDALFQPLLRLVKLRYLRYRGGLM